MLSRLQTKQALIADYRDLLPAMPPDQWRRIRGEQEIIVRYEPERAMATLPALLSDPADRARLVTLVRRLLADERVQRAKPTAQQLTMVQELGVLLGATAQPAAAPARTAATRRAAAKPKPPARPRSRQGGRAPRSVRAR